VLPIAELFNTILEEQNIPLQRQSSATIIPPKRGCKDDLNDHRPIALFSNLNKLLSRRLTGILDKNQPSDQAGFRAGFSNTDHLQCSHKASEGKSRRV
jgi:hypothetical protein